MKKLLLIRHAKSSWAIAGQEDFDRPLNDRGHLDAPMMAERIHRKDIKIDGFVSSPAKRALTTAQYFAKEFGSDKKDIIQFNELYQAMPGTFIDVISRLDDELKTIALFSHNPGITAFANLLTATRIDDMPTCAIFSIKADTRHWKDFPEAKKAFWFFDYPRNK